MNRQERRTASKGRKKTIEAAGKDAVSQYDFACSSQALGRLEKARNHFKRAIDLGLEANSVQQFIMNTPAIAGCLSRIAAAWPRPLTATELFGTPGIGRIADQVALPCLLQNFWICNAALEQFLTRIRYFMLQRAAAAGSAAVGGNELALYAALAQQCFINEYVFIQSDDESRQAATLRDQLDNLAATSSKIPLPTPVAVAAALFCPPPCAP